MFDVIFMSCGEPNENENFAHLKKHVPWAQWLRGAPSIDQAHFFAAKMSRSTWFWSIDGDNWIENFYIFYQLPPWQNSWHANAVGICRSKNPTNSAVYGWGGIKLWNKKLLQNLNFHYVDFTTTFPCYSINTIASDHRYNTSHWDTWRTVFREVSKLLRKHDDESLQRLEQWKNPNENFDFKDAYEQALQYAFDMKDSSNIDQFINCKKQLKLLYDQATKNTCLI